jgi:hypothetical protein
MRSLLARTALFAGFLLPNATPASAQFVVKVLAYHADGVLVRVSGGSFSYGCTLPLPYCHEATCYGSVEPCPLDQSCLEGVLFQFSFRDDIGGYQMKLAYGTTYRFSGYWITRLGTRVNNVCNSICDNTSPIPETTYNVIPHDQVGEWVMTPIGTSGSNVWVDVGLVSDYSNYSPCFYNCWRTATHIMLSPCPLEARYYPPNQTDPVNLPVQCVDGVATIVLDYLTTPDPPLEVLLAPGTYQVEGRWSTTFFSVEMGGGCVQLNCSFTAHLEPAEFTTAPLAVRETTWGQIKALYKN